MDKLKEEFWLEETKVRVALHHVLDPFLGAIESLRIRIIWLDVGHCDKSRLGIQIDLRKQIQELIKRSLKLIEIAGELGTQVE